MTLHKDDSALRIIGWREWISLPDLGVPAIKAKIDTGARTSSLHAYDLRLKKRGSRTFAEFAIHPLQRNSTITVPAEAEVCEFRNVTSSSGHRSCRPVIITPVELLGECWPIELTLANRDEMGFRMLLGREALRGRFLVNAGQSYYGGSYRLIGKRLVPQKKKKTLGKTRRRKKR